MRAMPLSKIAAAMAVLLTAGTAQAAPPLGSYNVDLAQTTSSGLSAGAFMAHQFHVAFSGTVRGAGIVAGGPYYCAQGTIVRALNQCMQTYLGKPDPAALASIARTNAAQGWIDPTSNLAQARVYLFHGKNDDTVVGAVVDSARTFYKTLGVPDKAMTLNTATNAGHGMATPAYGVECTATQSPYLNRCGFDLAGALLEHMYGNLNQPSAAPTGTLMEFDQTEFAAIGLRMEVDGEIASPSEPTPVPEPTPETGGINLNSSGYVYVPAACARKEPCKVHIAFHGCLQSVNNVGRQYVENAGYNRWADSNNIIVLYPQTSTANNACWDWWGYSGPGYATKSGTQMAAVRAMLDRLAGTTVSSATQ